MHVSSTLFFPFCLSPHLFPFLFHLTLCMRSLSLPFHFSPLSHSLSNPGAPEAPRRNYEKSFTDSLSPSLTYSITRSLRCTPKKLWEIFHWLTLSLSHLLNHTFTPVHPGEIMKKFSITDSPSTTLSLTHYAIHTICTLSRSRRVPVFATRPGRYLWKYLPMFHVTTLIRGLQQRLVLFVDVFRNRCHWVGYQSLDSLDPLTRFSLTLLTEHCSLINGW